MNASRLASATSGVLPNRFWFQPSVSSVGRVYIQDTRPRAKKFLDRSASRGLAPVGLTASRVRLVMGTSFGLSPASDPSVRGLAEYPALARLRSSKASALTMSVPPPERSSTLVLRAAG